MEKIIEGFGFSERERETSELETELNININSSRGVESLQAQGETFMEIFIGGTGIPGIYRGTTNDGVHIIKPTTHPGGESYFHEDRMQKEKYVWRDRAMFLDGRISGFRPLDRETLEAYGSGFDKVAHLGEFIDDSDQKRDS